MHINKIIEKYNKNGIITKWSKVGDILKKCVLFCLPYAGGSSRSYLSWKKYSKDKFQIVPVELSGRGARFCENKYNTFEEMVYDTFNYVKEYLEYNVVDEYAIFGHSMGSWIVYEIYKKIKESNIKRPIHIIFSGNSAPFYKERGKKIHNLPDDEFVKKILELGGASEQLLRDEKMGKIFIEILRNDYKLLENYECNDSEAIIESDISVFNGISDSITNEALSSWKRATKKKCSIYNFEGGHFFIDASKEQVVNTLEKIIFE